MLTALATLGLALIADSDSGSDGDEMPRRGNRFGTGSWILVAPRPKSYPAWHSKAGTIPYKAIPVLCTVDEVLKYESKINEEEPDPDVRTRELQRWLHKCEPGWVDDGYWDIIWIIAIRENPQGVRGPTIMPCEDAPPEPGKNRYSSADTRLVSRLLSGSPTTGNDHDVRQWMMFRNGKIQTWCSIDGVINQIPWYEHESKPRDPYPIHPGWKEPLRNWLMMCLPGDVIRNQFGFDWIIAVSKDAKNTAFATPEIVCDDWEGWESWKVEY